MNPPFSVFTEVAAKLCLERPEAVVIAPHWSNERWWERLMGNCTHHVLVRRRPGMFLMYGDVSQRQPGWDVDAFYFARGAGSARRGRVPPPAELREDTHEADRDVSHEQSAPAGESAAGAHQTSSGSQGSM